MGRDKLLLDWEGTVVLGSVLDALEAGGAAPVVVVVSPRNRRLQRWLAERGTATVPNPRPQRGMLSSVLEGVAGLGGADRLAATTRGLLVCPGDHPGLEPSTVRALCAALAAGAVLAVPVHRGRRGHPLAIGASLVPRIARLDAGVGLRELVARHADELVELAVDDPAVARDIDTPEDYRAARGRD
jgi:CTP:molybdopterin cytidylyltransferase MocA